MAGTGQKTQGIVQSLHNSKPSPQLVPFSTLCLHSKSALVLVSLRCSYGREKTVTHTGTALIKPDSEGNHILILQATYNTYLLLHLLLAY